MTDTTTGTTMTDDVVREQVRSRYAAAAIAVSHGQDDGCGDARRSAVGGCCDAVA